jgi:hypothetical protein
MTCAFFFWDAANPRVMSVTGCTPTDRPNAIIDCPTNVSSLITLTGQNFGRESAVVLIGSALCTGVTHDAVTPHRIVTCYSPPGTGVERYRYPVSRGSF